MAVKNLLNKEKWKCLNSSESRIYVSSITIKYTAENSKKRNHPQIPQNRQAEEHASKLIIDIRMKIEYARYAFHLENSPETLN